MKRSTVYNCPPSPKHHVYRSYFCPPHLRQCSSLNFWFFVLLVIAQVAHVCFNLNYKVASRFHTLQTQHPYRKGNHGVMEAAAQFCCLVCCRDNGVCRDKSMMLAFRFSEVEKLERIPPKEKYWNVYYELVLRRIWPFFFNQCINVQINKFCLFVH